MAPFVLPQPMTVEDLVVGDLRTEQAHRPSMVEAQPKPTLR